MRCDVCGEEAEPEHEGERGSLCIPMTFPEFLKGKLYIGNAACWVVVVGTGEIQHLPLLSGIAAPPCSRPRGPHLSLESGENCSHSSPQKQSANPGLLLPVSPFSPSLSPPPSLSLSQPGGVW